MPGKKNTPTINGMDAIRAQVNRVGMVKYMARHCASHYALAVRSAPPHNPRRLRMRDIGRRRSNTVKHIDWDDAYANAAHIVDAAAYPPRWQALAQAWRQQALAAGHAHLDQAYGTAARQQLDWFCAQQHPRGLAVFVHGGYWRAFDRRSWSHLAAGALARGWAVALPSYTLAPEAFISDISREIAQAIAHLATRIDGPIALAGHSAGGHLVTRMVCAGSPLAESLRARITRVLSISGIHDLRPLQNTAMNLDLRLDDEQAQAESPALLRPNTQAHITAWVGSCERPVFIAQTDLLANIWGGLGADIRAVHAAHQHHFNVIEALGDPNSELVTAWLGT